MNQVNKVTYSKGMNMDISKSKYPQGSYFVLTNGTIISGDSTDATEISTAVGNYDVLAMPNIGGLLSITYYTDTLRALISPDPLDFAQDIQDFLSVSCPYWATDLDKRLSIIGYATTNSRTFLFCKELTTNNYSSIFELIIDNTKEPNEVGYASLKLKYINDSLLFSYIGTEAIGLYENENILHLYWADGVNQLRTYNVADETRFFKDYTQLDTLPEVKITTPKLRNVVSSGNLPVGMIQYAVQYFNPNGQRSVILPPTQLIHLTTEQEGRTLFNEGKANFYHGADSGISSGKAVVLEIINIDTRYDNLRIIQIFHNSIVETPFIKIIHEQTILGSDNIYFTDDGYKFIGNLSVEEYKKINTPIIPKTIATKDNILFAGNIKEDLFSSSLWDSFCTRAYRFDSNKTAVVYNSDNISLGITPHLSVTADNNNVVDDWNGLDDDFSEYTVNAYNIPHLSDPSASNSFQQDVAQYKYYSDGKTLGGKGPNISFRFVVQEAVLDNSPYKNEADVNRVWPIYTNSDTIAISVSNDGIFTNDYRSPFIASRYKTYQKDDIYRFALVVYSKTGIVSEPKWIADIRMPSGTNINTGYEKIMLNYCSFVGNDNGTTNMNLLGVDFKISFPPDLLSEIQGYSIVRCKRDAARHILGNGVLMPYVFGWAKDTKETFKIKWSPDNRDSLRRRKSDKSIYADFVSNSFHRIQGYIGLGAHAYSGFAKHDYTYLNNGDIVDRTPITDTGVCAFVSPEHLFTNNLRVKDSCKVVPISSYKVAGNSLLSVDPVIWSDYDSELLYSDALKLSPRIPLEKVYPMELDSYEFLAPLDDIKIKKYYNTDDSTKVGADYILVNGLIYGTAVKDHLSFGSNLLLNIKEQRVSPDYFPPLRATIRDITNNDGAAIIKNGEFLLNCNIKQNSNPYGGQSLEAILNSVYISTGNYIESNNNGVWFSSIADDNSSPKDEDDGNILHPTSSVGAYPRGTNNEVGSAVYGGDVFLTMFQYLSQYGTDLTTEEITTPVARYTTSLLIPVESTVNCNLRHDLDIFTISKTNVIRNIGEKAMFRAESKAGSTTLTDGTTNEFYHDYAQEKDLYLYNTVFSKENSLTTYFSIKNRQGVSQVATTKVMASLPKLYGEYLDSWNIFGINSEIELSSTCGDINRLQVFKDSLYSFQNSGVAKLAVNEKSTSQDPSNPLIIGTTGILPYYQYITDTCGTAHKYSVVTTEDILLYFDTNKNRIYYLTGDDGDLSSITGLNSYFMDNKIKPDGTIPSIISVYDVRNKQVLMRFDYEDTTKTPNVLAFNKLLKVFTHFTEYNPNMFIQTSTDLFSQETTVAPATLNYKLYLENYGEQNSYYGKYTKLKCTLVVNPTVNELIKMFDFIEFMTTSVKINDTDKFNVLNLPITSIRVYNDYQDTLPIDLITLNNRDQYFQKQRNRTFRVSRLRDKLDTNPKNQLARMKDYYIYIDIEFNKESLPSPLNTEDIKFTMKDLFTSYRDLNTTQL